MKPSIRWIGGVILGWVVLPALLGYAQAEPLALAGPKPSARVALKSDPASCNLPPELLSRLAELRGSLPPDGLVGARVAAFPPQRTGPTLLPRPASPPTATRKAPSLVTALGGLPLGFIENQGQVDPQVKFYLRQGGHTLWLTPAGLVFDLAKAKPAAGQIESDPSPLPRAKFGPYQPTNTEWERLVFAQDFVGANPGLAMEARRPQPGTYNFFTSPDPVRWRTKVRAYREVLYREVWGGIDLKLSGNGRDLEQEFIVKPGGDPGRIQVAYRGIEGLRVASDGSLLIKTAFGKLRESQPRIYQEIDGKRVEVAGRFKLLSETAYTFEVGPYQQQYALVIDPTLVYSTYLGGSQGGFFGIDQGNGIAVDARGNAYVTGLAGSTDFPTMVPFQATLGGQQSAFITKLNATGSALIYSTFLGVLTMGNAIAVDARGAAYVTGWVQVLSGGTVPTTPGVAEPDPRINSSAFVTKLSPDGSSLEYSTYSHLTSSDQGLGIAVDADGNAYVTGDTNLGGGLAWARKLNPTGTAFLYSTFIAGADLSFGHLPRRTQSFGIALDGAGNAYVAGSTTSPDFPTTPGAFQQSGPGSLGSTQLGAFVMKLGPTGTPVYSTLLAGNVQDEAFGIAVDLAGHAYVTGYTFSTNFPTTPGAFQTTKKPSTDVFVTKLKPDGSGLVYSTLLGGVGSDFARGIAVDGTGNAHITGFTSSVDLPLTPDAFQPVQPGVSSVDAFLTKFNASGSALIYSTYLGATPITAAREDSAFAVALDTIGDAYITGFTDPHGAFPTTTPPGSPPPFQSDSTGTVDAFVAKFSTGTPTILSISTILPSAGGDTGTATAFIHGTGFVEGATVKLARAGEDDIVGDPVAVAADGRTVSATFDLTGKTRGAWNVVVTNPDTASATLPEAFTIEEGRAPQVWVDIIGRDTILARRPQTFYIVYGNRGNVDVLGVPLYIGGIPRDAVVTVGSGVLPPPLPSLAEPIDLSFMPGLVETNEGILIPLLIPGISPGFTGVLKIQVTVPSLEAFTLRAWAGPSIFGSPEFNAATSECLIEAIKVLADFLLKKAVPTLGEAILPTECAKAIVEGLLRRGTQVALLLQEVVIKHEANLADFLVRFLAALADAGISCAVDLVPALKAIKNLKKTVELSLQLKDTVVAMWDLFVTGKCAEAWGFHHPSQIESTLFVRVVAARDPNDKVGSQGTAEPRYLAGEEPLRYSVFFENEATATAPAQEVVITDNLDGAKLDLTTFSLGPLSFGDHQIIPPPGVKQFSADVDLRPDKNLIVRIKAGLDATGRVSWYFGSIDPATNELTEDPLGGFLPPNTDPPKGEGNVVFTVMPKRGLPTGTEIRNKASIVFDLNDPMDTPEWFNTLDNTKPASQVMPLAGTQVSASFPVQWAGTDEHSGILDYTVFVSEDGGPFTPFISNTPDTSATFPGQPGKTYAFFSIARDGAGNMEGAPADPDATTVVVAADTTSPAIVITTPADGAAFTLNATVAANYSCSDKGSGVAACIGTVPSGASIDTATVGPKSFTVNATDVAGNSATLTHQYSVRYNFAGFFAPIDPLPTLNVARPGRTVPIKWQLTDATGNFVSDLASFASLFSTPIACDAAAPSAIMEEVSATGGTVLRYDSTTNQFVFNWQTSSAWTGCRLLQLTLKDGTRHFAKFQFK